MEKMENPDLQFKVKLLSFYNLGQLPNVYFYIIFLLLQTNYHNEEAHDLPRVTSELYPSCTLVYTPGLTFCLEFMRQKSKCYFGCAFT